MDFASTFLSNSNFNALHRYSLLKKTQILLDWINTIDEPLCLLASELNDLKDGNVCIEIVNHYLMIINNRNMLIKLPYTGETNNELKFNKVIEVLIAISPKNDRDQLENLNKKMDMFYKDDTLLLELIVILRNLYASLNEERDMSKSNKQYDLKDNFNGNENNILHSNSRIKNYFNESNTAVENLFNERNNHNQKQHKPQKQGRYSLNNKQSHNSVYSDNISKNLKTKPKVTLTINPYEYFDVNNFIYKQNERTLSPKNKIHLDKIKLIKNPQLPQQNNNNNNTESPKNCINKNSSKIYSKKVKATINMSIGIQSNSKLNYIGYLNFKMNYFKFIKPTEPIVEFSYNTFKKYYTITKCSNEQLPYNKQLTTKTNYSKYISYKTDLHFTESPRIKSKSKIVIPNKSLEHKANEHQSKEKNHYSNEKEDMPLLIKKKIYLWLIDIGLIKDNQIEITQLPELCYKGILLCDLINRCEGRNETIKGISRKATTKSQIKVNINKSLNYLRTIEKFSSKNLWRNEEIYNGNTKVIWELLEDLYNYYSNKKHSLTKNKKNNNKKNNKILLNYFIQETPKKTDSIFKDNYLVNSNECFTSREDFNTQSNDIENNIINSYISKSNSKSQRLQRIFKRSNYFLTNMNNINHVINQEDSKMFTIDNNPPEKNSPITKIFKSLIPKDKTQRSENDKKIRKKSSNRSERENTSSHLSIHNLTTMNNNNDSYISSKGNNSCFVLFEKPTIKRIRNELQRIQQYGQINSLRTINVTNDYTMNTPPKNFLNVL